MAQTNKIRRLYFKAVGLTYFISFLAVLWQYQGLIGDDGIFSASAYISKLKSSSEVHFFNFPAISLFASSFKPVFEYFGLGAHSDVENLGIITAFLGCVIGIGVMLDLTVLHNTLTHLAVMVFYLNFVLTGQQFFRTPSDMLFVEFAFLNAIYAPISRYNKVFASSKDKACYYFLQIFFMKVYLEAGLGKLTGSDPSYADGSFASNFLKNTPSPTFLAYLWENVPLSFKKMLPQIIFLTEVLF